MRFSHNNVVGTIFFQFYNWKNETMLRDKHIILHLFRATTNFLHKIRSIIDRHGVSLSRGSLSLDLLRAV